MPWAHLATVCALLFAPLTAPVGDGESERRQLFERVADEVPSGMIDIGGPGSREAFLELLGTDLFLHDTVGPFDVYIMKADELEAPGAARQLMQKTLEGLRPLARFMGEHFDGEGGVIAGRRLPIVLANSKVAAGQQGFAELIALLDWAEDDYSGWKAAGNAVWTDDAQDEFTVRTWEVQLFNLDHPTASTSGFLDHGLGYYTIAHVCARLLRQGSWGMVPPWMAQGLIDEVDIATYGQAWVGGDWWERQTPGWYRAGWSGFVPQGSSPPPPVTGPPADLAVTVVQSGDSWQHRANSSERHWADLAADRGSEAPVSFRFMAENESFLPRDRAYARCAMHALIDIFKPRRRPSLLRLLDRMPETMRGGISDADPLTTIFNRAMGGVPAVNELEALSLEELAVELGRPEIAERVRALGGEVALALSDHRDQLDWLYEQTVEELDWDVRSELFDLFLEAEYYQQLREWESLGDALDRGFTRVFHLSKTYPRLGRMRVRLGESFWDTVAEGS